MLEEDSWDSLREPLHSLLTVLRRKKLTDSISSVVDEASVSLMTQILDTPEDCSNRAVIISTVVDVELLLDFILYLIDDGHLLHVDTTRKARWFMFKLMAMKPVIPRSVFIDDVQVRWSSDYIGMGGFGHVFEGVYKEKQVALKVLHKISRENFYIKEFCQEALVWRSLSHKNLLPLLGVYEEKQRLYLVSPFMKNGTLSQWRKTRQPSISEIQQRILEVAEGMQYIHSEGIVHGDLRGDNILLDADFNCKITDFGLTRQSNTTTTRTTLALSFNFAAPELFGACDKCGSSGCEVCDVGTPATIKRTFGTDIYAFGCLCYEIYFDRMPFKGTQAFQIIKLVASGTRPPRLDEPRLIDDAWILIRRCWGADPHGRPTADDIVVDLVQISEQALRDDHIPHTQSLTTSAQAIMPKSSTNSSLCSSVTSVPLLSLLEVLRKKPTDDVGSVVNEETVSLTRELLGRGHYVNAASELNDISDAVNLLDFMLYLFDHGYFSNLGTPNANRRARRLMLNVIRKTPAFPRSFRLSGVTAKLDYIGQDGSDYTFKGELRGAPIALKLLYKKRGYDDFCREALIWRSLSHESVLPFLGIHEDGPASRLFLVTPLMENDTLSHWRTTSNPPMAEIQKRMFEVAKGIQYIHSEGMVHGNLCGTNILLDSDFHAKIAGFSLARPVEEAITQSGVGSYNFAAPELFGWKGDEFSEAEEDEEVQMPTWTPGSDVYAFGCLYYEIHFGVVPFANMHELQIMRQVINGKRPPRLGRPAMSDKVWKLINRCWRNEPMRRPTMEKVVEAILKIN